jgi:DNA polymerase-4
VEKAGAKLRRQRLTAGRFGVVLDYSDGKRAIRQASAKPPASDDFNLFAVSRLALKRAWTRRVRIRHIRLICDRFASPPAQLALFAGFRAQQEKKERLMAALDTIRDRFGSDAVRVGRTISEDAA